ncbi:hypothetical protein [Plantactinospora endophytica]|uniref:HEAT repeat domain-containing protein n=1 Tax=Plantactinospora endophytica TaxID=673535 RepID=A0ABQ4EBK0_9ACTN|nr:hypothetical protein [Plantactinospora endophytica]GIG92103.1 hypothetical protein Pen02_70390 [Plantactinospora endophytica]
MAGLAVDGSGNLERIAWARLYHAYGPAVDVPGQLRALRDPDPDARAQALGQLFGNVCHQGTRWQASAYVVPFLVGLVDDPRTPGRPAIAQLLTRIAIGDLRDDRLPFDHVGAFAAGAALTEDQIAEVVRRVYHEDDPFDDDAFSLLADRAVVRWAAEAYRAAAEHVDSYRRWLADPDPGVAARAAALLAWFPATDATLAALLAVPSDRVGVRASANLTIAHSPDTRPDVDRHLTALLVASSGHTVIASSGHVARNGSGQVAGDSLVPSGNLVPGDGLAAAESLAAGERLVAGDSLVSVSAAVALAYRNGHAVPDIALTCLVDAYGSSLPDEIPGWTRAPRGFVALALQRLGLA